MLNTTSAYDFIAVMDGLLARQIIRGPHAAIITSLTRERASALLLLPDIRYMPAFKILDLLTAMAGIAAAIAQAPQLRGIEVRALLRESLSDETKLMRHFLLEAALERARYEPLIIEHALNDKQAERELILQRRWAAMRAAHQEKAALPDDWMDAVDSAVEAVLAAPEFRLFRRGPLLQMFAEMLDLARKMYQQKAPTSTLVSSLSSDSPLWRRYVLKKARYTEPKSPTPDIRKISAPHTIH